MNFKIISTCNTSQRGVDIVSEKGEYTLLIEAKGATSSRNTHRHGMPFDRKQIKTHISAAIFTAMSLLTRYKDKQGYLVGIALPCEKNHLEFTKWIKESLESLGIVLFWAKDDGVIIEDSFNNKHNIFVK